MSRGKLVGRRQLQENEKEELRQTILKAASEIIAKEGFEALSMRKLAERIGYSAGSIYLYFRNRDEIAKELSHAGYSRLLARMTAEIAHAADPAEELSRALRAYVAFGMENPETYRLILIGDPVYIKAVFAEKIENDPATAAYNILIAASKRWLPTRPDLSKTTPVQLAETLWSAAHGIVSLKLTCPLFPTSQAEELLSTMTHMLLGKSTQAGRQKKR